MTNFEKYKDDILKFTKMGATPTLEGDKIINCDSILCVECIFYQSNKICTAEFIDWLYSEYTPPTPKLTKREHVFCEAVETGWMARESDGKLWLFKKKAISR